MVKFCQVKLKYFEIRKFLYSSLFVFRAAIMEKTGSTKCVKIPRSLDGRMQVQHRKTLPHLLYCQIWRWPDIKSQHDLKAIDGCNFSYRMKLDEVIYKFIWVANKFKNLSIPEKRKISLKLTQKLHCNYAKFSL